MVLLLHKIFASNEGKLAATNDLALQLLMKAISVVNNPTSKSN